MATDSGSAALRNVAAAVSKIPEVPTALKDAFASLSASVSSVASSSGLAPDLTPVRRAAQAAWVALRNADIVPQVRLPGALPSLPSFDVTSPPSLEQVQAAALSDLTTTSLFDGTYSEGQIAAIVSGIVAVAVFTTATAQVTRASATASDAELPTEYNQEAIYRFWSTRPVTMFKRSVETAWLASGFLVGLQLDKLFGEQKKNEKLRARMLRKAVDKLGPAYIKVAQALSTRVDLLSPAYFEEIQKLQDRVAAYPTDQAMAIMEVRSAPTPAR